MSPAELAIAGLIGSLCAFAALWWFSRGTMPKMMPTGTEPRSRVSFLFDGDDLVDASSEGTALLRDTGTTKTSFAEIISLFQNRFDLPRASNAAAFGHGEVTCSPKNPDDNGLLRIWQQDNKTRIDLSAEEPNDAAALHKLFLHQNELAMLQKANEITPCPIWQSSEEGAVTWYNNAYAALYERVNGHPPRPDKPLFDLNGETQLPARLSLQPEGSNMPFWYNVSETRQNGGSFHVAIDSNAVVHAEMAQRNFVQTLAKTFAHLSIGLAIFNDERQLILFNPALLDLTELNAEFLSARPYLLSFFDELRNKRTMPEPKNYNSWRQQIADLVAAAADGRYSEIWSLANGRTYRVNGRPHPDGAIAFLFEDISAEVSLTRRFRAELELSQSVIDSLDEAIVVFSASGVLTISNNRYGEMWRVDPENSFADVTILDAMRDWQRLSAPSPIWDKLRDFVLGFQDRNSWSAQLPGPNGGLLNCDVAPLSSGATMVKFQAVALPPQDADQDAVDKA